MHLRPLASSRHRRFDALTFRRFDVCPRAALGFTLTEMLVAIAILIVVIIATSKIFGTASQITGIGGATQSVMQDAAAIEQHLRSDIARLTGEGFMAIRCVAVRNDVNQASNPNAFLLNPNLPPNALVRADQLLFFANGVESLQSFGIGEGSNKKPQGTAARIYYGHAFQIPSGEGVLPVDSNTVNAHDPAEVGNGGQAFLSSMFPWRQGNVSMLRTLFSSTLGGIGATNIYSTSGLQTRNITQPEARKWLLARQQVALVDDDVDVDASGTSLRNTNSKTLYLLQGQTARSIFLHADGAAHTLWGWTREIRNGRLDAAATQLSEIRRYVTRHFGGGATRPWNGTVTGPLGGDQRRMISSALYYPRAERYPPTSSSTGGYSGVHRVDQALTNHVIGSACSSFIVEWTYADRTGESDLNGDGYPEFLGVRRDPRRPQPWFGLSDTVAQLVSPPVGASAQPHPTAKRGVGEYREIAYQTFSGYVPAETIPASLAGNLERNNNGAPIPPFGVIEPSNNVAVYEALFGYNQNEPVRLNPATGLYEIWPDVSPTPAGIIPYTPLPSALRITMVLHDPQGKLENGREFQFVIDIPKRGR